MSTTNEAIQPILDAIEAALKIASGGWPAWIATGLIFLALLYGYWRFSAYLKQIHWENSQKKGEQNESDNVKKEQELTDELDDINKKIDEVKGQNPDTGKPPVKFIDSEREDL